MDSRVIDLTGKRVGSLEVLRFYKTIKQRSHWECKCDCGTVWIVASNNLGLRKTNSCGICKMLPVEESMSRRIYADYKVRASKKSIPFTLDFEVFKNLINASCNYCGIEKSNTKTVRKRTFKYNGIDRIDSQRGYSVENVVSCCSSCNSMKMDLSKEEFLKHIQNIFNFISGG